ncbi:gamma-glutamyl-gamma-aminobutyrate hydrolase family protein [Candidatus Woesearchaeota archaeon]|nr:gamma-glutamyl-gamma-aminobutyrate hydrolase family protein [Candidatus Woesearchaeota archaeon]
MRCLIVSHETAFENELLNLFADYSPVLVNHADFIDVNTVRFDFIVLSGGPIDIPKRSELTDEKKFIKTTDKPIFGICLGHQLFGVIFGATLYNLGYRREGFFNFELLGKKGRLFYTHEQFLKDAPKEFNVLKKEGDIIEVMSHKTKPFFGVQGHPEASGEFGEHIRDLFIERYVKNYGKDMKI